MSQVVLKTEYDQVPLLNRGKVRDMYDLDDRLLIVVTDRLSAFDHILPNGIPDKGRVLNLLSAFWFEKTRHLVKNHLVSVKADDLPSPLCPSKEELEGRFSIVKKAEMLPVECIVRGYLAGSGWKEYGRSKTVCGIKLPDGLAESGQLPEPIFTPEMIGSPLAERVKETSLQLYSFAADYARKRGIIIADTKFEFGMLEGELILCDEVLTPDSSRFWPAALYSPGGPQPSFDKQFVRDYLTSISWSKEPPVPELPADVVEKTSQKYREAYEKITGSPLPA
ncbi:MAG: phosphoribosylaminoimidazolesuccinocarboxamide synthase [Acidobacteriota bacterium]